MEAQLHTVQEDTKEVQLQRGQKRSSAAERTKKKFRTERRTKRSNVATR